MKNSLFVITLFILFGFTALTQDCQMFYPVTEGTELEIKDFDKKGKLNGSSVQKIISREENGNNISITVAHESYDDKGEKLMDGEFVVRCEDGTFYMDMRNMIDNDALGAYENMEIEIDANDMSFPSGFDVGTTLPNADISIRVSSGGMTMFTMTVLITNRKIEAKENITTEAGTFECYKMSYDIETKMLIKVQAKAVQWIAEEIGMVRSESYNKKGKLQGYSELSSLKQ
ncbi:MAG: DUF3108 domain-containing protein [Bacteroidales bacterium]|nr:DUF3108 domain-containing protein [Bacteroidales bacterium]